MVDSDPLLFPLSWAPLRLAQPRTSFQMTASRGHAIEDTLTQMSSGRVSLFLARPINMNAVTACRNGRFCLSWRGGAAGEDNEDTNDQGVDAGTAAAWVRVVTGTVLLSYP